MLKLPDQIFLFLFPLFYEKHISGQNPIIEQKRNQSKNQLATNKTSHFPTTLTNHFNEKRISNKTHQREASFQSHRGGKKLTPTNQSMKQSSPKNIPDKKT